MVANTCMVSRAARYGSMDIDIHNSIIFFSGAFEPPKRRSQADQTMCIDEQLTNYGVGPWDQS